MKKALQFCFVWLGIFLVLCFSIYIFVKGQTISKLTFWLTFVLAYLIAEKWFSDLEDED